MVTVEKEPRLFRHRLFEGLCLNRGVTSANFVQKGFLITHKGIPYFYKIFELSVKFCFRTSTSKLRTEGRTPRVDTLQGRQRR